MSAEVNSQTGCSDTPEHPLPDGTIIKHENDPLKSILVTGHYYHAQNEVVYRTFAMASETNQPGEHTERDVDTMVQSDTLPWTLGHVPEPGTFGEPTLWELRRGDDEYPPNVVYTTAGVKVVDYNETADGVVWDFGPLKFGVAISYHGEYDEGVVYRMSVFQDEEAYMRSSASSFDLHIHNIVLGGAEITVSKGMENTLRVSNVTSLRVRYREEEGYTACIKLPENTRAGGVE